MGSLTGHLEILVGSCWDHFGVILESLWGHFWLQLGSFCDDPPKKIQNDMLDFLILDEGSVLLTVTRKEV